MSGWTDGRGQAFVGHRCPDHLITECERCHRPMRPSRSTVKQYPHTVVHSGKGLCKLCARGRDTAASLTLGAEEIAWLQDTIDTLARSPQERLEFRDYLGLPVV